jgi:hypothetical protein
LFLIVEKIKNQTKNYAGLDIVERQQKVMGCTSEDSIYVGKSIPQ